MATNIAGIRPRPYAAASYRAFRISESGRTYPIDIGEPCSLQEALSAATLSFLAHKERLAIRIDGEDGKAEVHVYAIRRKAAAWVNVPGGHLPKRVHDLYADPICVLGGEVLA